MSTAMMADPLTAAQKNHLGVKLATVLTHGRELKSYAINAFTRTVGAEVAFQKFQDASSDGSLSGQVNLANCHFYGFGTKQDDRQGRKALGAAVNVGFAPAQMLMGDFVLAGEHGFKRNALKALELFELAAEKKDYPSMAPAPADSVPAAAITQRISAARRVVAGEKAGMTTLNL